jgi:pilus assembly protein CpaD
VVRELRALQIRATTGLDSELAANTIRVHADHTVMTAPSCPDWSKPEADEPNNAPSSNYSCATVANLAAMVANPADLVKPDENGKADAGALAHGAEIYRAGNLAKTLAGSNGYNTSGLSGVSGPSASGSSGGGQ